MSEFVDECRQEWKRLGVADPIANEMAADLMADIAEAEAEGGGAEDVLGDSFFDPRRFAASWAGARGVTQPAPTPVFAVAPQAADRRRRLVPAVVLGAISAFFAVGALVLAIGRNGASSMAVRKFLSPAAAPPIRSFVFRSQSIGPNHALSALVALVMFAVALACLILAVLIWRPRLRHESSLGNRWRSRDS